MNEWVGGWMDVNNRPRPPAGMGSAAGPRACAARGSPPPPCFRKGVHIAAVRNEKRACVCDKK
jgi:hypothetical protein